MTFWVKIGGNLHWMGCHLGTPINVFGESERRGHHRFISAIFGFLAFAGVLQNAGENAAFAAGMATAVKGSGDGRQAVLPVAIFGRDDRISLPPSRRHLGKSVGLLVEPVSETTCSAFCVDDRIVATAGHCIFRTEGQKAPKFSRFDFRLPGTDPQISTPVAGGPDGGHQFVAAPSKRLSVAPPIDAANDWALVVLEKPVCKGRSLPVARYNAEQVLRLSEQGRVFQLAYHRDYGSWDLAYGARCAVRRSFSGLDWPAIQNDFAKPDHVLLHMCDTGGASSGSPILADTLRGTQVVGINVGTYTVSRVLKHQDEVIHRYRADRVANTGVSTTAFRSRLEALRGAKIIANREGIVHLQQYLADLGHYRDRVDGIFGPNLRAAIEAFEREEGRPQTGLATKSLLSRLRSRVAEEGGRFSEADDGDVNVDRIGSHESSYGVGGLDGLR